MSNGEFVKTFHAPQRPLGSGHREGESQAPADTLVPHKALVLTDNDAAFASKLRMVEGAQGSIDMLYYAYVDDSSSAVFSEALLRAVARGVRIRLLLDYATNYQDLDYFTMLEAEARSGPGSFEVRFYNRPTRRLIRDAIFMTMGSSELGDGEGRPGEERKLEVIERALSAEGIPAEQNVSNLCLAGSGLLLSGWYGKNHRVMALALSQGQAIDLGALARGAGASRDTFETVRELVLTYWRSRRGPAFKRLANKLRLALIYLTHRGVVEQFQDALASLLPLRGRQEEDWQDWEFLTDYLHQKLLLVDDGAGGGSKAQLGGRNIGDPYHLRPGSLLADKLCFSDTDVYLEVSREDGAVLRQAFERLWDFDRMNATTAEVRQHAPNDLVANWSVFEAAEGNCAEGTEDGLEARIERALLAGALDVEERMAARRLGMRRKAAEYREVYPQAPPLPPSLPTLEVDRGARLTYLENLPFLEELPTAERRRLYGAPGFGEAEHGKALHHSWRVEMEHVCSSAGSASPRRIVLHNAYFLPPANLLRTMGRMSNGELNGREVIVQVLTNSAETTNFPIINPLAHHVLKAFNDYCREDGDARMRARFEFYEVVKDQQFPHLCLHSKVAVLGEKVLIGSANADVRSYMMDANNGVLIHQAPRFRERYLDMVDRMITDPETVVDLGEILEVQSREELKEDHLNVLRRMFDDQLGGLNASHRAAAEGLFLNLLDTVYALSLEVLRGENEALERYNRLLKFL